MLQYIGIGMLAYLSIPVMLRISIFKPGTCKSKKSLKGKVALITGSTAGLGLVTSFDFAKRGARLFLACRNTAKGDKTRDEILEQVPTADITVVECNLLSLRSVKQCADTVIESADRLDILMNNAGFGSSEFKLSEDGIESQLACNHLGHFYLTRLFLPLLSKSGTSSDKSRIVNLSSRAHHSTSTIDYEGLQKGGFLSRYTAYGQSKLANILFTRYLHKHIDGRNITVNSVHPGTCRTEFFNNYLSSYWTKWNPLLWIIFYPLLCFSLTSEQGAQTQIFAAVDESLEGVSGQYLAAVKISSASKSAHDEFEAEKLWRWSCSKTSLPVEI